MSYAFCITFEFLDHTPILWYHPISLLLLEGDCGPFGLAFNPDHLRPYFFHGLVAAGVDLVTAAESMNIYLIRNRYNMLSILRDIFRYVVPIKLYQ